MRSLLSITFKSLTWAIVLFFLSSYLVTESWTWGYRGKWTNIRNYVPHRDKVFTENELKKYDGTDPHLPIYIALDGDVYDVSKGRHWYGPTGNYHIFAGRDAARAFVTGCFKDHLTHDIRGLSSGELKTLQNWKRFYDNHYKYHRVGIVTHEPIDPDTPIPSPCEDPIGQKP